MKHARVEPIKAGVSGSQISKMHGQIKPIQGINIMLTNCLDIPYCSIGPSGSAGLVESVMEGQDTRAGCCRANSSEI